MKKVVLTILTIVLSISIFTTTASADAKKGQKYYLKKLKICKEDGLRYGALFAAKYDRASWESFKEEEKLVDTWKELCPSGVKKFDEMKPRHIENLYDFVWKFASDGEVPSCS